MNSAQSKSFRYGTLKLIPGERYRVVKQFQDYDCKLHPVGEEWVFIGCNVLPYDAGHTWSVSSSDVADSVIRMQWHEEAQERILEALELYVQPAQQSA
jgi:hypothetical protein